MEEEEGRKEEEEEERTELWPGEQSYGLDVTVGVKLADPNYTLATLSSLTSKRGV